ncbi:MAG: hypothetical protein JWN66_4247 [Sphingomonas bacterium]|uniref:hypothetical protein n=1 Tax=Sphingomonas bacterium TaxID=1895847 RepID=UPI0026204149|nr:hypothetical protein [Sphingomonas bacterium]MDB5707131.1 hypothetical protein [Sphingomonas bacterium]
MIARLILSLLLAAFALPAMAAPACHDAPAPMAAPMTDMPHHSTPAVPQHGDKAVLEHACIGCIPPSSLKAGAALAPLPPSSDIRVARIVPFRPGGTSAPATPPPQLDA